jgi:hypothetical protein
MEVFEGKGKFNLEREDGIDVVDAKEETVSPILGSCLYMNRLTFSSSTEPMIHARRKNVLPADSLQGIAFRNYL